MKEIRKFEVIFKAVFDGFEEQKATDLSPIDYKYDN